SRPLRQTELARAGRPSMGSGRPDSLVTIRVLMSRIDLHTHTTASDGSLSPTELVHLAKQQGVSALAVTDHDSVAGLAETMAAGGQLGITNIPGIEISCLDEDVELHNLRY